MKVANAFELLRTARADARLTVRQLAAATGVPAGRISDYENNRHQPSFAMVQRLLEPMGFELVSKQRARVDPERNGQVFADVLSLVDSIPFDDLHEQSQRTRPAPPTWADLVANGPGAN